MNDEEAAMVALKLRAWKADLEQGGIFNRQVSMELIDYALWATDQLGVIVDMDSVEDG